MYGNTASEEAQARTVLDYVNFIASSFGQSFLGTDFSAPSATIRNIMKTGTPDGTGNGRDRRDRVEQVSVHVELHDDFHDDLNDPDEHDHDDGEAAAVEQVHGLGPEGQGS